MKGFTYQGTVRQFRQALREVRRAAMIGYSMSNEADMRRLRRRLRRVEVRSLMLDSGGDVA